MWEDLNASLLVQLETASDPSILFLLGSFFLSCLVTLQAEVIHRVSTAKAAHVKNIENK